ncbi:MFS transporter [Longispora albida]|uniref:MFS transporter n=1 Tax=Longispora albida TaxID=203523 RepID=UPI0003659696|nr:MFS transporter [Longispora albida]
MQRQHLSLLLRRDFALLWFAGLISMAGDWMLRIALPIYVLKLTGSPAHVAGIIAASTLPRLFLAPFAGVFVDRWDRRRIMVTISVLQALAVLPLVLVHSAGTVPIAYGVAFAEAVLVLFFVPAEGALLPRLIGDGDLTAANSLNSLNNNLARLVGPALGGFMAALVGLSGAAVFDAVTFAVAAVLIALIRGTHRAGREPGEEQGFRAELAGGFRLIGGSRTLAGVLTLITVTAVGEGVMGSAFAFFVQDALHGGAAELGYVMSAQAVGGIAGGLLGGWIGSRVAPLRLVTVCTVLFGLIDLAIFNLPRLTAELWPQLLLFALVGVPGALMFAGLMAMIQGSTPDRFMGRVFAVATGLMSLAVLIGAGLAALFTERIGVIEILTIQGAGYVVGGLLFGAVLRGTTPAVSRPAESSTGTSEDTALAR